MARSLSKRRKIFYTTILLLGIGAVTHLAPNSYALAKLKAKTVDYVRDVAIQEGDFIFQHLPGPLTAMIADVTDSPYSHCGIIVRRGGKWFVLEAIGPVKLTPVNQWISFGMGDRFTILRLKKDYQKDIPQIIRAAWRYQGRPYDIQYEWDDRKIYCSELIYKAVYDATGMRLAAFEQLGQLAWQPYERQIRYIAGGDLPLERAMITPEALVRSDKLQLIYSNFPARPAPGFGYKEEDLAGRWQGVYSILSLRLAAAAQVDPGGRIHSGELQSGLIFTPAQLSEFDSDTGEFSYRYVSANQVGITIYGRMDKSRGVIFGEWRDSLGYKGTFLLEKVS